MTGLLCAFVEAKSSHSLSGSIVPFVLEETLGLYGLILVSSHDLWNKKQGRARVRTGVTGIFQIIFSNHFKNQDDYHYITQPVICRKGFETSLISSSCINIVWRKSGETIVVQSSFDMGR
ncbi:hypothetical protein VN97_g9543 [Penicillium thymicola]|uniref:Uncharacterized protein n=1 Tax=Penicillium thymicola TaxID=293382 RepID=A0AAI9TBT2_PENTH|nr:hypothetical protein VN97_g9543 [Penicillium thymicola]